MKYAWMKEHRDQYSVAVMARCLSVSRSGYYKWLKPTASPRAERSDRIRETVAKIFWDSNQILGSYKIAELMQQREDLETTCRNTVAAAMRQMSLTSRVVKRFKPRTTMVDPKRPTASNLLQQSFTAEAPNEKWVADITYLKTESGWVYLAAILDLFSRKIVGWALSESLATPLICDALRNAIEQHHPDNIDGLIHHSDRGCQYTSKMYQDTLNLLGITCSMSGKGCCYDNAVMERFFWSLKQEWTNHYVYSNLEQARLSVFQYIEVFYNRKRIHQSLGYRTPEQFEQEYLSLGTSG